MYGSVLSLFEDLRIIQDDVNFPILHGRYNGRKITIEAVADHVNVRKVPCLWILVTVHGNIPYAGTMDFLVRPQNTEFYSPYSQLEKNVSVPAGWPQHAILRSDNPRDMPPANLLTHDIKMFDEPKIKELLVSPRGVRVVYQLDQATRSNYMVLRQMIFDDYELKTDLTTELLDMAIAVIEDLTNAAPTAQTGSKA